MMLGRELKSAHVEWVGYGWSENWVDEQEFRVEEVFGLLTAPPCQVLVAYTADI